MTRSSAAASAVSEQASAAPGASAVTTDHVEGARPLRKDAQRNRELLLSVASEQFSDHGVEVPLEDIAKVAGVGIGTLYRNFPTRGSLIEAVYRREVAQLCESADELLLTLPPDEALAAWMQNFVRYVATKHGLSAALKDMMNAEPDMFTSTRARIYAAADSLLKAASDAGSITPDVSSEDLIRAMGGVCMASDDPGHADRATRLMTLLFNGMRYGAPSS